MEAIDRLRAAITSTPATIDPESMTQELIDLNEARGVFDELWIDPKEQAALNRALRIDFEKEVR